jgi:hypothetical protein
MTEKIDWRVNVDVVGGPTIKAGDSLIVEAYDKIDVIVPKEGSIDVDLQPGAASQVSFLLISASDKSAYSHLTCKPLTGTPLTGTPIKLDAPLILIGNGAITLLASTNKINFSSNLTNDAALSILIGRKAVVPPE